MLGAQGRSGSLQSRRRYRRPRGLCVCCDSGQPGGSHPDPRGRTWKGKWVSSCRRSGGRRQAGGHQDPSIECMVNPSACLGCMWLMGVVLSHALKARFRTLDLILWIVRRC